MRPLPNEQQFAELERLAKAAGNIFAGTFDRAAYEKALAYYREIFFTEEAAATTLLAARRHRYTGENMPTKRKLDLNNDADYEIHIKQLNAADRDSMSSRQPKRSLDGQHRTNPRRVDCDGGRGRGD